VARWAAEVLDEVTVSLDLAREAHDRHRLPRAGEGTWDQAHRTAMVVSAGRASLVLRVTVTSLEALPERVTELVRALRPSRVHLEPVYLAGRARHGGPWALSPGGFAEALVACEERLPGVKIVYAGARLGEVHGRFCPVLQDSLSVTVDGHVTGCFAVTERRRPEDDRYLLGGPLAGGAPHLDEARLRDLRRRLTQLPTDCLGCYNQWHCADNCPSTCPARDDWTGAVLDGPRCATSKAVTALRLARKVYPREALPEGCGEGPAGRAQFG
jgi:hypothetical protein